MRSWQLHGFRAVRAFLSVVSCVAGATRYRLSKALGGRAISILPCCPHDAGGGSRQASDKSDIVSDPELLGNLFDGAAGAGFESTRCPPDNGPRRSSGEHSAAAGLANPLRAVPFRLDFLALAAGVRRPQPSFLNKYDQKRSVLETLDSGGTFALRKDGYRPETANVRLPWPAAECG